MMNIFSTKPTLFSRLAKVLLFLTITTVTLFTLATLLITYSFEDVLFNERLKQAHIKLQQGKPLPYDLTLVDSTDNVEPSLLQKIQYFEVGEAKTEGEFSVDQRHYHYLVTNQGTILYDTTDVTIIDRALDDIFLILSILLIPVLFLTYWVARYTASYALKPFSQLTEVVIQSEKQMSIDINHIEQIKEEDVKALAIELHDALRQKAQLLDRQLLFNQGIAHELRTPLQVMEHSVELLSVNNQKIIETAPYRRLTKSIIRMTRLCNGLLWLTSDKLCRNQLNVREIIMESIAELNDVAQAHNVNIELDIQDNLYITMPREVFELLIINLLNNVIHHGLVEENGICWNIKIDNRHIEFSNSAIEQTDIHVDESRFGIGLTLVTELAHRFGMQTDYKYENKKFYLALITT